MPRTLKIGSKEYMVHTHITELDFLRRLSVVNGEMLYSTGAFLQPVTDRIKMYEEMIERNPSDYAEELKTLAADKKRQEEHLKTL